MNGTSGNDILVGGPKNDKLFGKKGNDTLLGGNGNDRLYGGKGNDTLLGGKGADKLYGDKGNDTLLGDAGNDLLFGGKGQDTLLGGDGSDKLYGGSGNDTLLGGAGNDYLFGGCGMDTLVGEDGNDRLFGGSGNDTLLGGAGNDYVDGGKGNDRLVYNLSENLGACDFYAGGRGCDTLVLELTYSEFLLASVQEDLENFKEFLAAGCGWFEFSSLDLRASGFERLEVVLLDNGPTAPAPAAPVAVNDSFDVDEDGVLVGSVLGNDTDIDSAELTAVVNSAPEHGTLTLNADGSFTYTPSANFNGSDSFTYLANDGSLDSNIATVTINVAPVNDAPVALDESFGVDEDNVLVGLVLGNDTDMDSLTLTATLMTGTANGVLAFNTDGSFTYTPNANFNGSDSFTYLANDGSLDANIATVTINVAPVNDAPVAQDDSHTTAEDSAVTGNVLTNDTDVDSGDTLAVSAVNGGNGNVGTEITLASGALVTVNADGSYTYDPNGKFEFLGAGETATDSFTYVASDPQGASSDPATVTVTITGVVRVAVIGVNPSAVADTVAQLDDSTAFSIDADAILLSNALDWSNILAGYDVVVVGSSGVGDAQQFQGSQLFPALRGFVDAGGGVVTTGWFAWELNNMYNSFLTSAPDADYVSPVFRPAGGQPFTWSTHDTTITVLDSGHAITQGLASYNVDAGFHEQATAIDATATQLASGPDFLAVPTPTAIAYDEVGDGLTVYLGGIYLADPNLYDTDPLRSGTSDELLEQAVAWAGGGDEDVGGLQLTDFAADIIL